NRACKALLQLTLFALCFSAQAKIFLRPLLHLHEAPAGISIGVGTQECANTIDSAIHPQHLLSCR
ncbi:MAG: hypothetical protein WBO34_02260, partial [Gammaproteobacteria bacterium]